MIRRMLTPLVVLFGAFIPACSVFGPEDDGLDVEVSEAALALTNRTDATVYTFEIERGAAAYTDFLPCSNPEQWSGIPPGKTRSVPLANVVAWTDEAEEVLVYWWHCIEDGEGDFSPDSVRSVLVSVS